MFEKQIHYYYNISRQLSFTRQLCFERERENGIASSFLASLIACSRVSPCERLFNLCVFDFNYFLSINKCHLVLLLLMACLQTDYYLLCAAAPSFLFSPSLFWFIVFSMVIFIQFFNSTCIILS